LELGYIVHRWDLAPMGCKLCVPAALHLDVAGMYSGSEGLPNDIIQVDETSSETLIEEFVALLSESFCGSTSDPPEAAISWAYDPECSGENPAAALTQEPSDSRKNYFRYMVRMGFRQAARHGGCFALLDKSSGSDGAKIVAATITFPPNNKKLYLLGTCEMIYLVRQLGGASAVPPAMKGGSSAKRLKLLDQAMHLSHSENASEPHLYVWFLAAALREKGKGYGKRMMNFLKNAADNMNVKIYLECGGQKNESFYQHHGYQVKKRYPIEYKGCSYRPDGLEGISAMVYQKK